MPGPTDKFLKTVLRSGLLDRGQLEDALRAVPRDCREDPASVAEHLVKFGKLSRFQARKLLQGKVSGLLLGSFEIIYPLGRGGMGNVFMARDHRSGELLALKVLPPRRARAEERLLARFRREMEMSQRVAHDHLARTFEAGVFQGVYYIAMEFIPGKTLYQLVNAKEPLAVPRAAALFAEAAAGLDHAHGQGLIHRDLKPSNIMITPNDHAKVLDLGLALMQGETTEAREVVGGLGYVVGSMDYIAPEQTENAATVDARADIYGLGCTLYFALTGHPPFPGGTSREKMLRHRTQALEPLTQVNPLVPEPFAALVERMMAKKPEQRMPSAAAVRDELLAWSAGQPARPLDRKDDTAYQSAITALASADVRGELIADVMIVPDESAIQPVDEDGGAATSLVGEYLWLGLALAGFWVIVLLLLGLVLLLR
jgi:eukaryotic-like serine/threonine-protein kinase